MGLGIDENNGVESPQDEPEQTPQDPKDSELEKLRRLVEYKDKEIQKLTNEAKKAFESRDNVKQQMKQAQAEDAAAMIEDLKAQIEERDRKLQDIENQRTKEIKLNALTEYAKKAGLKERYFDKLDRFVDLNNINPEEPITIEHTVDVFKSSMPDLFDTQPTEATRAWEVPKLNSGAALSDYEAKYQEELRKPRHLRNMAMLEELNEKIKKYKQLKG